MLLLPFLLLKEKRKQKNNTVSKTKKISVNFNKNNIIKDRLSHLYKPRQITYTQALINSKTSHITSFITNLQKTLVLSNFNILLSESQLQSKTIKKPNINN